MAIGADKDEVGVLDLDRLRCMQGHHVVTLDVARARSPYAASKSNPHVSLPINAPGIRTKVLSAGR